MVFKAIDCGDKSIATANGIQVNFSLPVISGSMLFLPFSPLCSLAAHNPNISVLHFLSPHSG
jgi:hypothetical protein